MSQLERPRSAGSRSSAPVTACASTSTPPARASSSAGGAPRPTGCRRSSTRSPGNPNRIQLNIQEIKQPELDAALIAQGIADQLARRVGFRRAMKRADPDRAEGRRPRRPGPVLGPARRLGDVPQGVLPRGPGARCTPCGPTSTTASARPRPPSAASASRSGSTRATSSPTRSRPRTRSPARRPWPSARPRARATRPAGVITAGGGRRRRRAGRARAAWSPSTPTPPARPRSAEGLVDRPTADIVAPPAVPDELERLLAEDEEIERRTRASTTRRRTSARRSD